MITPKTIQQRDEDWIAGRQSGEACRKDRKLVFPTATDDARKALP